MWRFPPQPKEVSLQMMDTLGKMCGRGERFEYTISGTREQVLGKNAPKPLLVNMKDNNAESVVVVVLNNSPLDIGASGERMLLKQFKVLRTDFTYTFEGAIFHLGENIVIRIGKMKRLHSMEMCDFCDIRWAASGQSLWESSGMSLELLQKIAPTEVVSSRKPVTANFAKIPAHVPFGSQHQALQFVKLYEDVVIMERGTTTM